MNTGLPTITSKPADAASPKASSPAQAGSINSKAASAPNPVSLPVVSSSSTSVSESGRNEQGTPQQEAKEKPSLQEVIQLSEKLNENVQKIQRDLNFTVDDSLGEIVVKVIDRTTQEVIRQIPSEEMLSLSRNIEEVNSLLFDKIKA